MLMIIAGAFALLAVILHIRKVNILKSKIAAPNIVYVDREGIDTNPPQHFIETFKNIVMNIKVDDEYTFTVAQIPFLKNLRYLKLMGDFHRLLVDQLEYEPKDDEDRIKSDLIYKEVYMRIIGIIYDLSYQFVKNKKKYRKRLYDRCENDVLFTLDICEQVSDYWKLVKKKALLLGQEATLRQTVGEEFSWNLVKMDTKKAILTKSRYGPYWNTVPREMTGYLEKTKSDPKKENN